MSQRLTRKEIKRKDQFLSTVEHTMDYSRSHVRMIVGAVVAVVVAVGLTIAIVTYLRHRTTASNHELAEAMEVFSAPVVTSGSPPPQDYKGPTFPDEVSRRDEAEKQFQAVVDHWGSSPAGALAKLYLASIATEKGDLESAQKLWSSYLGSHQDNVLAMQVQLNLFELRRAKGEAEEVAAELQGMLSAETRSLPKDVILFQLASTLEQLNRSDEAVTYYQQLVDDYPQSLYTNQARVKTSQLGGGGGGPVEAL